MGRFERTLAAFAVQIVYTGLCTGEAGESALARRFAGRVAPTGCGLAIAA